MKRRIAKNVLQYCLTNLSGQSVLEFHQYEDGIRIPYLMNDVIECYILLGGARVTGELTKTPAKGTSAEAIRDGERGAVIVRTPADARGRSEIFTIWYEGEAWLVIDCYQYHRIMHYWRKDAPHLRNQVGIISNLYDKRHFIGEFVCEQEELELCDLILFGPFRAYSPVKGSLDEFYPESEAGAQAMLRVAQAAGDRSYAALTRRYMAHPTKLLKGLLTLMLRLPGHDAIYTEIDRELTAASGHYARRRYEGREGLSCELQRITAERMLEQRGYSGDFPSYSRGMTKVTIYEEQPFTKMEDRPFSFHVLLLREQRVGFYIKRSIEKIVYPGKVEDLIDIALQDPEKTILQEG